MEDATADHRPTRIAHVVGQLTTGGMEKLLVEFARHTDRARFALRFVSLTNRGRVAEEIEACGWPVTAMGEASGPRPGLIFRLARLFLSWDLDVVHTHNSKPLLYAAPAARMTGVAAVVHTRHGQHYRGGNRETARFRLAARLADRVVCVSDDSANLSLREGIAPRRVSRIWNGIDVARFHYLGPCPDGPVVSVGRLSPEKDPETLVRAAAAIAARQDPSFRLEMAGAGECLPRLQRLAAELGLNDHVKFLGDVRDVPALLARASVFVLPSLTEGVSLTLLEAMARGLPVVATRVGGNPEVVVEGETGLLVPSRAPADLAAAMLRLRHDPAAGRRMGIAGHERVARCFDARRMVADYQCLYLQCLRKREAIAPWRSPGSTLDQPLPPPSPAPASVRDRLEEAPDLPLLAEPGAEPVARAA